jgi:hypothetical protein
MHDNLDVIAQVLSGLCHIYVNGWSRGGMYALKFFYIFGIYVNLLYLFITIILHGNFSS